MSCFSHLCLDTQQTWISCFHLRLQTVYLQNIVPPIRSTLSLFGHHLLTHPCWPVLRDTSRLQFCLSFWEWSLCSIYRLSSSDFFILRIFLRFPSFWSSSFPVLGPQAGSRDRLSDDHLERGFPWVFRGSGVLNKVFQKQTQEMKFQAYIHFCVFSSVTNFSLSIIL